MAYWWASQGKNYSSVIVDGTLWTCPRGATGITPIARKLLKSMRAGDIVFHYADNYLRAVSRVVVEWQMAPRADNYPKIHDDDWDTGWLVRVEPINTELWMEFKALRKFIRVGDHGPLNKNGVPAQKYISELSEDEGERLLAGVGIELSNPNSRSSENPHWIDVWGSADPTDAPVAGFRRREQSQLRDSLLRGRLRAPCDLCGRELPKEFLVAAHITPRSILSEMERRDFASISMLACVLGCDALFEKGLIVVDDDGLVLEGMSAGAEDLRGSVTGLLGRLCTAHSEETAKKFWQHRRLATA